MNKTARTKVKKPFSSLGKGRSTISVNIKSSNGAPIKRITRFRIITAPTLIDFLYFVKKYPQLEFSCKMSQEKRKKYKKINYPIHGEIHITFKNFVIDIYGLG